MVRSLTRNLGTFITDKLNLFTVNKFCKDTYVHVGVLISRTFCVSDFRKTYYSIEISYLSLLRIFAAFLDFGGGSSDEESAFWILQRFLFFLVFLCTVFLWRIFREKNSEKNNLITYSFHNWFFLQTIFSKTNFLQEKVGEIFNLYIRNPLVKRNINTPIIIGCKPSCPLFEFCNILQFFFS